MRTVWGQWLPILAVRVYRLQPARFRGWMWGLFGFTRPTSHLAIPAIRAADGPCRNHCSPWAQEDCWHWVLRAPQPLRPYQWADGQRRLWKWAPS